MVDIGRREVSRCGAAASRGVMGLTQLFVYLGRGKGMRWERGAR